MGLVKATIHAKARALLNELIAGFWTDAQINEWIDDAALDISSKTYCYETMDLITLATSTQLYDLATNCLKILGLVYSNKGLDRITPWMEGKQTAIVSGEPEYFYEFANKVGLVPVPTSTENGHTITRFNACSTNDITNIPLKFQIPAVLFVTAMGLLKERQYGKAGQLLQLYTSILGVDRSEIEIEKTEQPGPQSSYVLKTLGQ